MTKLQKLLSIASEPLSLLRPSDGHSLKLSRQLKTLVECRNGFSAFECALVVFPSMDSKGVPGIHEWNDLNGWRGHYRDVIDDEDYCFAQDLFGLQFALAKSGIVRLNPESGSVSLYAKSIEDWAKRLLENYEEDTAWPLAHEWQIVNGVLPPQMRLLPKIPFVLGGEFEVDNLVAVECHQAMEYWGKLYDAIRNVPEGQRVSIPGWID
ncbi:hypothetical protein LOC68_07870 [Blastopirellula sp. JC732]|uniref:DUF1851 domain-containing protein n=1 Tax=Blastopirellula sediminis TaxID=2894196 RepID=A0A9X1MJK6_9BACT|nr:hypothetical protein [Blastopirellula sediminis]MCC9608915.1 hypothetical protein [Blastopirellula sediminis]MCC9628308.1 hypothetical protein [Blastopirellula sediminis]